MVIENALDSKKKSLQHLLSAIEGAGRRTSAEALHENVYEKGKNRTSMLPLTTEIEVLPSLGNRSAGKKVLPSLGNRSTGKGRPGAAW